MSDIYDGAYKVPRKEVSIVVQQFLRAWNIVCVNAQIAIRSLQLFAENRLDFVDNVLLAYTLLMRVRILSRTSKKVLIASIDRILKGDNTMDFEVFSKIEWYKHVAAAVNDQERRRRLVL